MRTQEEIEFAIHEVQASVHMFEESRDARRAGACSMALMGLERALHSTEIEIQGALKTAQTARDTAIGNLQADFATDLSFQILALEWALGKECAAASRLFCRPEKRQKGAW